MPTDQRLEILTLLESAPDNVLEYILRFLKELQDKPTEKAMLIDNFQQVLMEESALLKRFAQ